MGYHVANMHFENFEEVVRRLGLKMVEVEHIGGCFLVVDPRVPRRWLRERPWRDATPATVVTRPSPGTPTSSASRMPRRRACGGMVGPGRGFADRIGCYGKTMVMSSGRPAVPPWPILWDFAVG